MAQRHKRVCHVQESVPGRSLISDSSPHILIVGKYVRYVDASLSVATCYIEHT